MLPSDPPDVVRALVVAGDIHIPYVSTGRGAAVVLLTDEAVVRAAFLRGAPRRIRLLVPEAPRRVQAADETAESAIAGVRALQGMPVAARWMDDFLDALGLGRAWLVADAMHTPDARAYAAAMPERVLGLAELDPTSDDPSRLWDDVATIVALVDRGDDGPVGSIDTRRPRPNLNE
jgi:pimeloyl-ACP methyl ester carboxylesterase